MGDSNRIKSSDQNQLDPEIFDLREVTSDEVFLAKYQDFVLKADSIILLAPGESVL